jgi:hypothetical protein
MRGRSPPSRERKGSSDRMCGGGPWGEASARSAPGWGSSDPPQPLESSSSRLVNQESSSKNPEESPKPKRPWNRTMQTVRMSSSSSETVAPEVSSEKEESTFLVRVKKGETKAKVLFLNNQKSQGWEGPFDMSLTVEDMIDFNAQPAPRAHTWPTSVNESESFFWGGGEWRVRALVRDVVYWFHKPLGVVGKWSRAIVEKVILPTELQYREGWTDIMYQIMQTPMGDENYGSSIAKEDDMRPSLWGDPTTYACMPSNTDALHSIDVVGIDTCSALLVSTREEDILFQDR